MLKDFYIDYDKDSVNITSNFHTHNYLCGHAGGTVSDYVKEALDHGFKEIGISDHCTPPVEVYQQGVSLDTMETLYLPQFDEAEALYGDRIKIYKGVEIEFFEGHDDYYKTLLTYLDYLVLGQHIYECNGSIKNSYCDGDTEKNVVGYFKSLSAGLRSGHFAMLAHPDLIFYGKPKITDKIVSAFDDVVKQAVKCDIPLELNANGIRYHQFRYPTDLLVELCKKYNAKVIISADCHSPDALCDDHMRDLYAYVLRQNLNLVTRPNFKPHNNLHG